jgi:hypothetical protein
MLLTRMINNGKMPEYPPPRRIAKLNSNADASLLVNKCTFVSLLTLPLLPEFAHNPRNSVVLPGLSEMLLLTLRTGRSNLLSAIASDSLAVRILITTVVVLALAIGVTLVATLVIIRLLL